LAPKKSLAKDGGEEVQVGKPDQYVRKHLEPGRQAQNARHSAAPGKHSVNVPGQPLRAFSTFVTVKGSHAFRPGQQSMVHDTYTGLWDEPSALERERAMGFMDNTTCAPSITEADRRRLLGSTMDMHALTFLWVASCAFSTRSSWIDNQPYSTQMGV
jgi:hypothetical protein